MAVKLQWYLYLANYSQQKAINLFMNYTSAISLPAMKNGLSPIKPMRFIGVCVLLFILICSLPESIFAPLNHATAHLSGECLALFGKKAEVAGDLISLNGFRVQIITECTALYSIILFGAFIFSSPASPMSRLAGLAAGAAFLSGVNILRIAAVTAVGAGRPALFEIFHVYLGQVVMVIMVIAACLAWLHLIQPQKPPLKTIIFFIRFSLFSTLLFLVWFVFNVAYVKFADDHVVRWLFSLNNVQLEIPYGHMIYYQTFNIVTFIGLVMAGGSRLLRDKIRIVAAGLAIIVAMHVLFRVCNVLTTAFGMESAAKISGVIYIIGQYMIPVLLWLVIVRKDYGVKTGKRSS
jgi:exosortase H (IPTLxxWG-CTERM-specific)